MSEENVELAYRAFDAINRRDLGALLALMDDDVEVVSRIVFMGSGFHGHDGIRRWWENWFNVFTDCNIEVVDVGALGDRIVAALRALGNGAGSDVPFEDTIWLATRWRRGKCVWWRTFYTRDEALEAAGLREYRRQTSRRAKWLGA
jgi:ketosteroid isomerase-like protein